MRQPGMTLIEILVVISIIAILTSILLPVMFVAQRHASEARCIANLKQVGMATTAFRQETGMYPAPGMPIRTLMSAKLLSEMKSCPADPVKPKPHDTYSPQYNYWGYSKYADGDFTALPNRTEANALYPTLADPLRHYWDITGGYPDSDFPGLVNTNAPASTIVTVCKLHYPTIQRYFILRVDGSVENNKFDASDPFFFTLSKASRK